VPETVKILKENYEKQKMKNLRSNGSGRETVE